MTKENSAQEKETKKPDFTIRQYRSIRLMDTVKQRKETIGCAWTNENGSLTLRLNGVQVIEGDLYLFPADSKDSE